MSALVPVSPLSLNQLTRDYWSQYDPAIIAQLAQLANDPCYQFRPHKSPADDQELLPANGYVTHGLRITPGSVLFGVYLPAKLNAEDNTPTLAKPGQFTVQVTDVSLQRRIWDDPIASVFLSNYKPTYQSCITLNQGSFPHLLCAPYPIVGSGMLDVEIQETSGVEQRIQLVFGVLEVCRV